MLESVQGAAPPPRTSTDDIIATARRMRTRRTVGAAAGGTAAVLAVMVAAVAGFTGPSATVPTAGSPSAPAASAAGPEFQPIPSVAELLPPADTRTPLLSLPTSFRTVLGEYRIDGYRIGPAGQVTPDFQELPVYRDGETWRGDDGRDYPMSDGLLTFYRPGVYQPKKLGAEEPSAPWGTAYPVTVAGRPGIAREMSYGLTAGSSAAPGEQRYTRTAIAWQYRLDAWATYVPRPLQGSRPWQDGLDIGAAVTAKPVRPVTAPYRLGFVPAGWQVIAATATPATVSSTLSEVYLHRGPVAADARGAKVDISGPNVRIAVFHGDPKSAKLRGRDGVHCHSPVASCTIVRGDHFIEVEGRFAEGLGEADIRRIVDGLTPVDIADRDAWVPVSG